MKDLSVSINTYFLLKETADKLLLDSLSNIDKPNFRDIKRYILNDLDKYNVILPSDLMIKYYNYCLTLK